MSAGVDGMQRFSQMEGSRDSGEEVQVRWLEVEVLMSSRLLPEGKFYASLDRSPDILVRNVRGNEFRVRTNMNILRNIKLDFFR